MYTKRSAANGAILISILALTTPSYQQKITPTTNFTKWKLPSQSPNEQSANVSRYLEEARGLSKPNFRHLFQNRCIIGKLYPYLSSGATEPGWFEPYPAFDGVYFVGSPWVSAWAIDTGDGLILIDALDDADEARELIIAGIQKFGFEGSDIKAVLVSHEHADHYGGACWLQETFDTSVYMSEVAWDGLATDPANPGGLIEPPTRNLTLEDGVGVTVGNLTVTSVAIPGHTAGTVSFLFPVYENGFKHGISPFFSYILAVWSY
jgi:metallo-beta-lactamase class B